MTERQANWFCGIMSILMIILDGGGCWFFVHWVSKYPLDTAIFGTALLASSIASWILIIALWGHAHGKLDLYERNEHHA